VDFFFSIFTRTVPTAYLKSPFFEKKDHPKIAFSSPKKEPLMSGRTVAILDVANDKHTGVYGVVGRMLLVEVGSSC